MQNINPISGLIFDIKRFALHDGPGIRITVFFKGCPLSCQWCHNPESRGNEPEIRISKQQINNIEFHCNETIGTYYTVDELMTIIRRERVFMDHSQGGVTFSGGEPMLQIDFLEQILVACKKEGIHTVVDTSGLSSRKAFERIIPFTDIFLYDIKHLDNEKHRYYTGASNKQILENLILLIQNRQEVQIRVPIIPGINDDDDHINQLYGFLRQFNGDSIKGINLLPYHKVDQKYLNLGKEFLLKDLQPPDAEALEAIKQKLGYIINVKIGG